MGLTVVMVAKAPLAGRAKTRLAAAIGAEAAAALAHAFLEDLTYCLNKIPARRVIAWDLDDAHPAFDAARAAGFEFVRQPSGTLGERLDMLIRAEARRADAVVVIGSDSPTLSAEMLTAAFERLEGADVVLGPSFDGGYYLLGVRSAWFRGAVPPEGPHPLFTDIAWSTTEVLGQTLRRCRAIGARVELGPFWYDVDTVEDLSMLKTHLLDHLRPSGLDVAAKTAILLSKLPYS